jgi:transglutaminase-like putative cysteine protease
MLYEIIHTTEYVYDIPVSLCHNIARLTPRNTEKQVCTKTAVSISPEPDVRQEYYDFFGNKVLYFAIQQEHKSLTVTVRSEISKGKDIPTTPVLDGMSWEQVKQELFTNQLYSQERPYTLETPMTSSSPLIHGYAQASFLPGRSFFEAVSDLMSRIYADFEYRTGYTTIATPLEEVMENKLGVCQDFAHLAIACIRSFDLPARYISGYIETQPLPGETKLEGADASHAWFSVFIPGNGWIDFDPTNNVIPADQHITLGWGRDYSDITPLKGIILSSGSHTLNVSVDVKRVG